MSSSRRLQLTLWLLIAVLVLGLTPLAKKAALLEGVGSLLVSLVTALIAMGTVMTWLFLRGQLSQLRSIGFKSWSSILLIGAMGSGLVSLFGVIAMTETSASNRALFQSAYPIATAIAARLMLDERLQAGAYFWIVMVVVGLVFMNFENAGGHGFAWTFWLLLSTLPLVGLADVIAKRSLGNLEPGVVAFGRALGAALILILLLPWIDAPMASLQLHAWLWMILAGLCMGVFAVALYQLFDRTATTLAATIIALAPLLTMMLEVVFFQFSPSLIQWAGMSLALFAIVCLAQRA